jgi:hypothetical protein
MLMMQEQLAPCPSLFSADEDAGGVDLPEDLMLVEELGFLDNITSCDKVENCLMLSEYEQNLMVTVPREDLSGEAEAAAFLPKTAKWSLFRRPHHRRPTPHEQHCQAGRNQPAPEVMHAPVQVTLSGKRKFSVIEEDSV